MQINLLQAMNYPLISEYVEAIKMAEDNFEELSYLRPVLDDMGQPVMSSGNFAVVFKMKDERDGKLYAVRCFHRDQEGREESYRLIEEELKDVESPYLVSLRYIDKELFVDSSQTDETEFPVLLMDWVEGITLDKYLRENLDDQYALEMLAYRFSQLAQWLIPQPFAHGDLKPDNILVREDGTLVLVDYDGMYVPAMKGQKARELGSPDFRHPLRTEDDFDEHIDDFPLVSILLSLKAISINPSLLEGYGATDRLLFTERDYRNINKCFLLKELFPSRNREIDELINIFTFYLSNNASVVYPIMQVLDLNYSLRFTAIYTDEYFDSANKYIDGYGVEYSSDRKVLFHWQSLESSNENFPSIYKVNDKTEIICDEAFEFCEKLECIFLPKNLKYIGEKAFVKTKISHIINESPFFQVEDDILFSFDKKIIYYYPYTRNDAYYEIPRHVKKIMKGCFYDHPHMRIIKLQHVCYNFSDFIFSNCCISIPKGTKRLINVQYQDDDCYRHYCIRPNIFEGDLIVDNGVIYSSNKSVLYRFPYWLDIEEYKIDEKCTTIGEFAFDDSWGTYGNGSDFSWRIRFNKLKKLYLPSGLIEICDYAFVGCGKLQNLVIPDKVNKIGHYVFGQCVCLKLLTFQSIVKIISHEAIEKGKTLPGDIPDPSWPWAYLKYHTNYLNIICPKEACIYYKDILGNENSQIQISDCDEKLVVIINKTQFV